jgi:hypothetical protein
MSWGMLRDGHLIRWCDRTTIASVLSLALLAGGCAGGSNFSLPGSTPPAPTSAPPQAAAPAAAPASGSSSLSDKLSSIFTLPSANSPQVVENAPQADVDCPLISIRGGASTLRIPPPTGDDNSTMALKYQGTFVRAARECAVVSKQMVMKVGVEGRVIVGPAGGPGQVDVPLRIAVVFETPTVTKPIVTKFIRLPVTIGPGQDGASFAHVESGLSFPMPSAAELDSYTVYIGFDPLTAAAQDKEKVQPKPKAKPPKPKVNPSAPTG